MLCVDLTPNMLKKLLPLDGDSADATATSSNVNVVIVPGVGVAPPEKWGDRTGRWLENLVEDCSLALQLWTFEYNIDLSGSSITQQLADQGETLLTCLDELCETRNVNRKPLFFICHSLGGIVLKRALSLTTDHVFQHLHIIDVIFGMVFLGTPHLPFNVEQSPNVLEMILRCRAGVSLRRGSLSVLDNSVLARFCHDFELVGVQVPIVSAFEKAPSKIHEGMFAKFREPRPVVIITEERGTIRSKTEVTIGIELDHNSICNVQVGGSFYRLLHSALETALSTAKGLITQRLQPSSRDWNELLTLRSQTTEEVIRQFDPAPFVAGQSKPIDMAGTGSSNHATFATSMGRSPVPGNILTNFETLRTNPRLPCFSVRTHKRNDDFFPRTEVLDLIDQSLLPTRTDARISTDIKVRSFAVCGMGGIGKTQLAVEYAYSRRDKFDAVFWVTADDKNILAQEFARIAIDLGLEEESQAQDLTVARELVKGWLTNPVQRYDNDISDQEEAKWLLIFDNIDDFDTLEEFWPATASGSVLTTSRDPLAKHQIYTVNQGIDLEPLNNSQASDFLESLTSRFLRPTLLERDPLIVEVVSKLGGLPLLIVQMAGVMSRLRLSYRDFLTLCNASGIEGVGKTGVAHAVSEHVYTISYRIGLDGLSSKSLGLLFLVSMLDPDRIPERILTGVCSTVSNDVFPNGLGQYFEARTQLLQTSLINQNPETRDIYVHRIVQDIAREKLNDQDTITMYDAAIHAISLVWPFATIETRFFIGRYRECATLFPSIIRLKNAYSHVSSLPGYRPEISVPKLFIDAGWYWFERGLMEESREWFQLVQSINEHLEDKTSDEAAYVIRDTFHNQGTAAGETNDSESFLRYSTMWLELLLERKTEDGVPKIDYELGQGFNETGVAYAMSGMYEKALTYFVKSIETFQALPDYRDTMLGWPESNVGLMYWMLGNLDDAEQALLEIVEIYQVAYGVDDTTSFRTGKMLYALGNVYVSKGQFDKGLEYHTRCLKQYRTTLGDRHHRLGDICHRLADDYLRLQNYEEARKLIDQSLKVFKGRPGYKQELTRSTYKSAQLFLASGNSIEADRQFLEAFNLRRAILPEDKRPMDQLTEEDYDSLVAFWSR